MDEKEKIEKEEEKEIKADTITYLMVETMSRLETKLDDIEGDVTDLKEDVKGIYEISSNVENLNVKVEALNVALTSKINAIDKVVDVLYKREMGDTAKSSLKRAGENIHINLITFLISFFASFGTTLTTLLLLIHYLGRL
ncbi:MAG: hypothetical protein QXL94_01200 [Candidatus Parvarchaeum sp.]